VGSSDHLQPTAHPVVADIIIVIVHTYDAHTQGISSLHTYKYTSKLMCTNAPVAVTITKHTDKYINMVYYINAAA
jgi:hypothetical protein